MMGEAELRVHTLTKSLAVAAVMLLVASQVDAQSPGSPATSSGRLGLFDVPARQAVVQQNPELRRICNLGGPTSPLPPQSVEVTGGSAQAGILSHPNPHAEYVRGIIRLSSMALLSPAHARALSTSLSAAASARSMTRLVPDNDRWGYIAASYNQKLNLSPIIFGYDIARQLGALQGRELAAVRDWLDQAVSAVHIDARGQPRIDTSYANHETAFRGLTFLLWGAASGNQRWIDEGIAEYERMLRSLREDGSNNHDLRPTSLDAGPRALRKQNQIVGFMVMMAEMAAYRGVDLYGRGWNGRTVHTAASFLARGLVDESIVTRIAGPGRLEKPFVTNSFHNDETMSWLEPYAARFPNSTAVRGLLAQRPPSLVQIGLGYGGNLACFYRSG